MVTEESIDLSSTPIFKLYVNLDLTDVSTNPIQFSAINGFNITYDATLDFPSNVCRTDMTITIRETFSTTDFKNISHLLTQKFVECEMALVSYKGKNQGYTRTRYGSRSINSRSTNYFHGFVTKVSLDEITQFVTIEATDALNFLHEQGMTNLSFAWHHYIGSTYLRILIDYGINNRLRAIFTSHNSSKGFGVGFLSNSATNLVNMNISAIKDLTLLYNLDGKILVPSSFYNYAVYKLGSGPRTSSVTSSTEIGWTSDEYGNASFLVEPAHATSGKGLTIRVSDDGYISPLESNFVSATSHPDEIKSLYYASNITYPYTSPQQQVALNGNVLDVGRQGLALSDDVAYTVRGSRQGTSIDITSATKDKIDLRPIRIAPKGSNDTATFYFQFALKDASVWDVPGNPSLKWQYLRFTRITPLTFLRVSEDDKGEFRVPISDAIDILYSKPSEFQLDISSAQFLNLSNKLENITHNFQHGPSEFSNQTINFVIVDSPSTSWNPLNIDILDKWSWSGEEPMSDLVSLGSAKIDWRVTKKTVNYVKRSNIVIELQVQPMRNAL